MENTLNKRPSVKWTAKSLARVGVVMVDEHLACSSCGSEWWPNTRPGGKLPRGWWLCERGCNEPAQTS